MNELTYSDLEELKPLWAPIPPGQLIQRELDALHVSQSELALRLGVSKKHLNQVVNGVAPLSADLALALERTIGAPAQVLLRFEADWRAHNVVVDSKSSLSSHLHWIENFPRDVLLERNIVDENDDELTVVEKLLRFFGVNDPSAFEKVFLAPQVKYKRNVTHEFDQFNTALWLRLVARKATERTATASPYSAESLRAAASELRRATTAPIDVGFRAMQERLLSAGVILTFVPEISDTRISVATLWLSSDRPLIALTDRYKFVDSFWFSLAHSISHVLLHLKRTTFVDDHSDHSIESIHERLNEADEHERAANKFAEQLLLGSDGLKLLAGLDTHEELGSVARSRGVDPGIIAGLYGDSSRKGVKFRNERKRADLASSLAQP